MTCFLTSISQIDIYFTFIKRFNITCIHGRNNTSLDNRCNEFLKDENENGNESYGFDYSYLPKGEVILKAGPIEYIWFDVNTDPDDNMMMMNAFDSGIFF